MTTTQSVNRSSPHTHSASFKRKKETWSPAEVDAMSKLIANHYASHGEKRNIIWPNIHDAFQAAGFQDKSIQQLKDKNRELKKTSKRQKLHTHLQPLSSSSSMGHHPVHPVSSSASSSTAAMLASPGPTLLSPTVTNVHSRTH
jgi:hypothetical protein